MHICTHTYTCNLLKLCGDGTSTFLSEMGIWHLHLPGWDGDATSIFLKDMGCHILRWDRRWICILVCIYIYIYICMCTHICTCNLLKLCGDGISTFLSEKGMAHPPSWVKWWCHLHFLKWYGLPPAPSQVRQGCHLQLLKIHNAVNLAVL